MPTPISRSLELDASRGSKKFILCFMNFFLCSQQDGEEFSVRMYDLRAGFTLWRKCVCLHGKQVRCNWWRGRTSSARAEKSEHHEEPIGIPEELCAPNVVGLQGNSQAWCFRLFPFACYDGCCDGNYFVCLHTVINGRRCCVFDSIESKL